MKVKFVDRVKNMRPRYILGNVWFRVDMFMTNHGLTHRLYHSSLGKWYRDNIKMKLKTRVIDSKTDMCKEFGKWFCYRCFLETDCSPMRINVEYEDGTNWWAKD